MVTHWCSHAFTESRHLVEIFATGNRNNPYLAQCNIRIIEVGTSVTALRQSMVKTHSYSTV